MSKPAARVLAEMASRPWLIRPAALETMLAIAQRSLATDIGALEARLGQPLQDTSGVTIRDGVATVRATGPLFRYANLFTRMSGATAFSTLARDFTTALENRDVLAILLEINSPGGEVDGTLEFARMVLEGRSAKPIEARIDGEGASAAYWIASAASRIHASQTSIVGSIGAVVTIEDWSESDAKMGLKVHEFVSTVSPRKRPDPNTKAGKADFQHIVDVLGQLFVESVAANRDTTVDNVLERYGQGGVLIGQEALDAGMVDSIATYEEAHAQLVDRVNARSSFTLPGLAAAGSTAIANGGDMSDTAKPTAGAAEEPARLTRAQLEAQYPTELGAYAQERVDAALTAERARVKAIDELAAKKSGHAALVAAAKADGSQTAATLALAITEAESANRQGRAAALRQDEQQLDPPAPSAANQDANADSAVSNRVLSNLALVSGGAPNQNGRSA